ncbi:glycosyltransferase, partial [Clavibacter michiganensis]|uniref:glycosyltransferase n=1 Tax=Clavibacter michiganensis TaxID=28447 RepID=UPI002930903A
QPATWRRAAGAAPRPRGLPQERSRLVCTAHLLPRRAPAAAPTAGTVFVCPSGCAPLGIVTLEAMACGAPVVGTATGGIPEVVDAVVTGPLVPIDQATDGTASPTVPQPFVRALAAAFPRSLAAPYDARPLC